MTVSVILEGTLKEGERDGFTAICTEAFKATRAFDGCQGIYKNLRYYSYLRPINMVGR